MSISKRTFKFLSVMRHVPDMKYILCILFMFIYTVYGLTRIDPLVETNVGLIRGLRATDGDYSMFLGIPFAKVNESNPFGASTPYPKFENIFEAYDDSAVCPQIEEFNNTLTGTLDCLHLNIYVPATATARNRLPVLVWIYGGAFRIGFANRYLYGPNFFVRHDVILVTVNYRLGPYGFMCLDTPEIPGNQGLKDQLLSLQWIKDNIEAFGGDADKITIFGESAGGICVDHHLLSNNEKLYDKIIIQSGTSLSPVIYEPIRDAPQQLAEYLGFPTSNMDEALEFLTKADTNLVIAASHATGIITNLRPCIEKEFEGVESFITKNWITADIPNVRNMPILIGFNNDERLGQHVFGDDEHFQSLNVVDTHLSHGFNVDNEEFEYMHEVVNHFYFGDKPMGTNVKRGVIDFESDFMYIHPTYRSVEKYLQNNASNVFLYVFSYVGERNFGRQRLNLSADIGGAMHADEITYLFDVSYLKNHSISPDDQRVIDQMTTMWTNFVKYGNPTPLISDLLPVAWPPIIKGSSTFYMDIGSELSIGTRPFNERSSFWDLFYWKNKEFQHAYPGADIQ